MQTLYSTSNQKLSRRTVFFFLQKNHLTGPRNVMSKQIKDLGAPSSSPIGFEVKWHSSRFDIMKGKKTNTKYSEKK